MSDPEVPQPERPNDVDHVVDSANAGLADAEAARAEVPGATPADPDLAAFEEAERAHPGTFASAPTPAADSAPSDGSQPEPAPGEPVVAEPVAVSEPVAAAEPVRDDANDVETVVVASAPTHHSVADTAYLPPTSDAETQLVPSEPIVPPAAQQPQPIFVQAPEPPQDRGNRGTAGAIGLLAAFAFAILYLGTALGLGALAGDVTLDNLADAALEPLTSWGLWVPVVVFFIGFWLLGAIINRGRWGLWVVFGLIVGVFAYGGHLLGQLFEAPFWTLTASEGSALISDQALAPLAIAAFVFGRELTIWFGAWAARSGARKTELNAEAQREYERTLEAGPTLAR